MPPAPPHPLARARARASTTNAVASASSNLSMDQISTGREAAAKVALPSQSLFASMLDPIGDTSARHWEEVFDTRLFVAVGADIFCCYTAGLDSGLRPGVVCILVHGGGHCALSWGLVADILKRSCGVVAFDSRGHAVVRGVFAQRSEKVPDIVLVGHSMGGAIAVRLAASRLLGDSVKGLVVIDVVEGTAMSALPHMRAWLQKRTKAFDSVEKAVRYVVRARHVRNVASARLSVPQQLVFHAEHKNWEWRTNLEQSAEYWPGWFQGLSQLFLSVPGAKMLLLAGVDRLDKDLMIGQMQGKFQQQVLPEAGHVVQEDRPDQTATTILDYLRRNMFIDSSDCDSGLPITFQQRSPIEQR
jgi:protein phosphatase methylesterase 1